MSRLARSVALVVVGAVLAAAAGCAADSVPTPGSSPASAVVPTLSASPGATLPPVGADCRTEATKGHTLRLTNGAGLSIAAVDFGTGASAVVLAHQSDSSLCEWLPYGEALAAKGFRVLAFDFAGSGSSALPKQKTYVDDLRTGVNYLRGQGVTRIVIMGASMGATMSVTAAAAITPAVDGVIALSPPLSFDGVNAEKAAPSLRTPSLYIAGELDGDYPSYAKSIEGATPVDFRELLIVPGAQHGIRLLDADVQSTQLVRTAVEQFLTQHAPPAGS
jgi:pimeloyl-ACP methyl ester carboxylesterase